MIEAVFDVRVHLLLVLCGLSLDLRIINAANASRSRLVAKTSAVLDVGLRKRRNKGLGQPSQVVEGNAEHHITLDADCGVEIYEHGLYEVYKVVRAYVGSVLLPTLFQVRSKPYMH